MFKNLLKMKKCQLLLSIVSLFILSSCGSISTLFMKERPVHLMGAPSDLQVKVNGESKNISSEYFGQSLDGYSTRFDGSSVRHTTDYYTAAVKLPFKNGPVTMELYSPSKKQSATVELTPKRWSIIFWGNMFSFPLSGHILDGITDNNKILKPNYIDVEYALQGKPVSEWRGKAKLKSKEKKAIRKGK